MKRVIVQIWDATAILLWCSFWIIAFNAPGSERRNAEVTREIGNELSVMLDWFMIIVACVVAVYLIYDYYKKYSRK